MKNSKLARIMLNMKIKKILSTQADIETLYMLRETIQKEIEKRQKIMKERKK